MTYPAREENLNLKFMSPIDNIEELMEKPTSKNKTIKGLRTRIFGIILFLWSAIE